MREIVGLDSMPEWLGQRASVAPEQLALLCDGRSWTYAELDAAVNRTARRLATLGAGEGTRVATLLRNGPRVPLNVHAMSRIGAVLVPLNTRLSASEIAWQFEDCGAALLLVDEQTAPLALDARKRSSAFEMVSVDRPVDGIAALDEIDQAEVALRERLDPAAVHSIVYTSGTTGRPKGAMLTYGNHWWSAIGSALNLGTHTDDRWLACMPLFHVGGMAILLRAVIYGICAVIQPGFDPAEVNRAIDEEGVTIVSVVATMLQRMLAERGERPYPSSFRCALLGGGPAPRPLLEECARRGVPVVQTYGLTETGSQVATLAPRDALTRLGSAGKALFPNELRIVDEVGQLAASGEPGEIVVRGPVVTAGYADRPEETARAIRDGWLHTGDLGYLDDDGYLFVLDRRTDLIVSGGENVYPAEVEAVLLAHPAVEEACVVALPDVEWGQVAVAAVRLRAEANVDSGDLLEFCRTRLARYKVPREIRFAAELPRNASGKLLRRVLRDAWRENGQSETT
ncbi:MAG TPA: o-succinylbenzoate--CoA ligase [Nitrolancea sp.]|nr:o-succinylbenzoate--CoA ligase [Nitrolancea sp.]